LDLVALAVREEVRIERAHPAEEGDQLGIADLLRSGDAIGRRCEIDRASGPVGSAVAVLAACGLEERAALLDGFAADRGERGPYAERQVRGDGVKIRVPPRVRGA